MKCNTLVGKKLVRNALAAMTSLAMTLGLTACSRDYTVAYVYSVSAANGTVSAFAVDYQSGVLTQISGSPFATQFTNPVTLVASPNGKFVYVVGGTQNSQVETFAVGTDGKLYGQKTVNITGTYPTAAAVDPAGKFLYVVYTYQTAYTPVSKGPGGVTGFPINSDGSLGTAFNAANVGNNPVAIVVTPYAPNTQSSFVYVVDDEGSTANPGAQATVLGYAQNTTTGALTPASGTNTTTMQGYAAGVTPSAIAADPTGRYVYVTDKTSNVVYGYQVQATNTGNLSPLVSSPTATGQYPVAITIDPRGKYVYVANYNSNTVSSYSLVSATGSLGGTSGGNFTTATGPTCVSVESALGIYLFTSNRLDGSISAAQLSPNTGALSAVENTPFPAGTLPSCVVAVANGEHASSIVNP
jgi:6-phosphogluconolactonase (cycloisomerase 2 family)